MTKLPRPPLVEERLLAVVDSEWRTAREIYAMFGEGAVQTVVSALARQANAGKIERRYDAARNVQIARYRTLEGRS